MWGGRGGHSTHPLGAWEATLGRLGSLAAALSGHGCANHTSNDIFDFPLFAVLVELEHGSLGQFRSAPRSGARTPAGNAVSSAGGAARQNAGQEEAI